MHDNADALVKQASRSGNVGQNTNKYDRFDFMRWHQQFIHMNVAIYVGIKSQLSVDYKLASVVNLVVA